MKFLPKFYSSIPLIIIGGIIIWMCFRGNDYCDGFPESIIHGFFLFLLIVFFFAELYWALLRYKKTGGKFNFIPLGTATIITVTFLFVFNRDSWFPNKIILTAENIMYTGNIVLKRILLKENGRFEINLHAYEYNCIHKGTYLLNHDTLIFERNILSITDSMVTNKYFIDYSKGLLYPIELGKISTDSTKYFKIGKETYY